MSANDNAAARGGAVTTSVLLALVGSLCAIYMVSQFLRNSVGVLAPELARELSLSPEEVGLLSSIFFLSFAAVQIPLGIALDRWGARACMLVSVSLALAGALVFALAPSFSFLVAGRLLMGLGCSSFFMAPLTIYARWFAPDRFSTLAGLHLGFGTIGTILATAPLGYAAAMFGWRASFVFVAVLAGLAGVLVLLFVRDRPPGAPAPASAGETVRQSLAGVGEVIRVGSVWQLFAMHFASYSALLIVLGLWGGPFLADVYGAGIERRGEILLVLACANVIGMVAYGPLDRLFDSRKVPVLIGAGAMIAVLTALALMPMSLTGVTVAFALFGLSAGFVSVQTAHGRALFPDRLVGRGITFLNMGTMLGVFTTQAATGLIVGLFEAGASGARPPAAYSASFLFAAACLLIATLYYLTAADRRPSEG